MEITCPHCHAVFSREPLPAITPDSPEKKLLFSGELNKVTCPVCGKVSALDQIMTYRDASTDPAYIVYYMPLPEDRETEDLEHEVDAMATDVFSQKDEARPVVRLVFFLPDFLEKIAIHELGYDDRLVEYAKLELFRNVKEPQLSRTQHRLLLDYSHSNEKNLFFLVFDRNTQKHCNVIQVEMEEFKALMRNAQEDENVRLELEAAFPGCYVSADRLL